MILGTPTKLTSQFRLTYNMILNLLRVEALRVEEMIKRSFSENASQRLLPDQQKLVTEGEKELLNLPHLDASPRVEAVRRFYDLSSRLVELNSVVVTHALEHSSAGKIFVPGRVLVLRDHVRRRVSAKLTRTALPRRRVSADSVRAAASRCGRRALAREALLRARGRDAGDQERRARRRRRCRRPALAVRRARSRRRCRLRAPPHPGQQHRSRHALRAEGAHRVD